MTNCGADSQSSAPTLWGMSIVESEYEMLREKHDESKLFERRPFESSRQATYEDTVTPRPNREWEHDERD
jgi:hypothetical protein